jgi:hypothetical protein
VPPRIGVLHRVQDVDARTIPHEVLDNFEKHGQCGCCDARASACQQNSYPEANGTRPDNVVGMAALFAGRGI